MPTVQALHLSLEYLAAHPERSGKEMSFSHKRMRPS